MVRLIIATSFLVFFTAPAHADYVCAFQNGIYTSRSFDSSWVNVKTLESAINMAKNHTLATVLERKKNSYTGDWVKKLYVMCHNEKGNLVAFSKVTSGPPCRPSKWDGSYDCAEVITSVEDLIGD